MANGIYVAMSGAVARQEKLDAIADNLANSETAGFKAERGGFASFLPPGEVDGPESPAAVTTHLDLSPGPLQTTGQPLDVTPEQGAFLPVQLQDQTGYTRNGRLSIGADGQLSAAGHPLLDASGQPIAVPPGGLVEISPQGVVTAGGATIAQLGTYTLGGSLNRAGPNVITVGENGAATPSTGHVKVGTLEGANYDMVEGMVEMITAQRQFESSMQAIQTYKSISDTSSKIGTVQ